MHETRSVNIRYRDSSDFDRYAGCTTSQSLSQRRIHRDIGFYGEGKWLQGKIGQRTGFSSDWSLANLRPAGSRMELVNHTLQDQANPINRDRGAEFLFFPAKNVHNGMCVYSKPQAKE